MFDGCFDFFICVYLCLSVADCSCYVSVRTSVSLPVTAAATAIAGLTRWVRTPRPWRFSKLRGDVDAQRSPGAGKSPLEPTHIEHAESRHSNPAAVNILSSPAASARRFTSDDPGEIIAGITVRRAFAVFAAACKSSKRACTLLFA